MKKTVSVLLCSTVLFGCGADNEINTTNYSGQDLQFLYSTYTASELDEMQKTLSAKRGKISDDLHSGHVKYDDSLSPEMNVVKLKNQLEQRVSATNTQEKLVAELYPKSKFEMSDELIAMVNKVNETFKLAAINHEIAIEERYIQNMYKYSYDSGKCQKSSRRKYTATSKSEVGCAQVFIEGNLLRKYPQIEAEVQASLTDFIELYRSAKDQHTLDKGKYHQERKVLDKQVKIADLKFGSKEKISNTIEAIESSLDRTLNDLRYAVDIESFTEGKLKIDDFISENYKSMFVAYNDGEDVLFQRIEAFGEDVDIQEFKVAPDNYWLKTISLAGEG